jgi:hypothetical protein
MTVELAQPRVEARTLARVKAVPTRYVLAAIVGLSFVVRWLLATAHVSPYYFPDEYLYPALARGIAETGAPVLRGETATFPGLLEPLLTAPFWIPGDPQLAYTLTQGLHALAMSLAAIPVYLLSRRLGLGSGFSLAAGALAVAGPNLMYASFMLADPIAYPLALAAVYVGVCALAEPTRRNESAFVAFAGLATFARLQYAVLPIAFVAAALVLERGRVTRVLHRFRLSLVLLALPLLALAALGPARLLGPYFGLAAERLDPNALGWVATDLMLLAYAAGWVLVPGALVGIALALARPRTRTEAAFAALGAFLAAALIAEAALIAGFYSERFQERYLFALLPLVAPAFGVYVKRGWPWRGVVAVLAIGMLAVSARVPLAGYTAAHGKDDSPTLRAVLELEAAIGVADGSLVVAALAAVLSLFALALALRRTGAAGALGAALAACAALSVGAFSFDRANAASIRTAYLPEGMRWVDDERLDDVALLQLPGSHRARAYEQLFWNTSVNRLFLLGSPRIDSFAADPVRVTADGRLLADGQAVRQPLLVQTFGSSAVFRGVERVAQTDTFDLLRPRGTPRLALLAAGRYADGWLARTGHVAVWPDGTGRTEGTLRLVLWLPPKTQPTPVRLTGPGFVRRLTLAPGGRRVLEFEVSTRGPWAVFFRTSRPGYLSDGRVISVAAEMPVFERAPSSGRT